MAFSCFELHRLIDGQVYRFRLASRPDGLCGYRRDDQDLWIVRLPILGWVAIDPQTGDVTGRPWDVLPHAQAQHPPEGVWVSRKGAKSYVYDLRYPTEPAE